MAEVLRARYFRLAVTGVLHHQLLDHVRRRIAAEVVEMDVKGNALLVERLLQDGCDVHRHLAVERAVGGTVMTTLSRSVPDDLAARRSTGPTSPRA